jgi:hypothetical protein
MDFSSGVYVLGGDEARFFGIPMERGLGAVVPGLSSTLDSLSVPYFLSGPKGRVGAERPNRATVAWPHHARLGEPPNPRRCGDRRDPHWRPHPGLDRVPWANAPRACRGEPEAGSGRGTAVGGRVRCSPGVGRGRIRAPRALLRVACRSRVPRGSRAQGGGTRPLGWRSRPRRWIRLGPRPVPGLRSSGPSESPTGRGGSLPLDPTPDVHGQRHDGVWPRILLPQPTAPSSWPAPWPSLRTTVLVWRKNSCVRRKRSDLSTTHT